MKRGNHPFGFGDLLFMSGLAALVGAFVFLRFHNNREPSSDRWQSFVHLLSNN